jgi:Nucleoside-diphosphate-sugar epimerases
MTDTKLSIVLTGADTELGQETVRQFVAQGHKVTGLTQDKNGAATVRSHGGIAVETDPSNAVELRDAILAANADVVVNLTPQLANTLLSDGQDWKGFYKILSATTGALLAAVKDTDIKLLIHTSYTFLYGNTRNATESTPLSIPGDDPIFQNGDRHRKPGQKQSDSDLCIAAGIPVRASIRRPQTVYTIIQIGSSLFCRA